VCGFDEVIGVGVLDGYCVGCVVVNIIIRFDVRPRTFYRRHVSSGVVLFVWCFGVIVRYSTVFHPNPKRIGV